MTEYKDNWREIAKASEKDPKVIDILENGPRSLTQAWLLPGYAIQVWTIWKVTHGGFETPPFSSIITSVKQNNQWVSPKKASLTAFANLMVSL